MPIVIHSVTHACEKCGDEMAVMMVERPAGWRCLKCNPLPSSLVLDRAVQALAERDALKVEVERLQAQSATDLQLSRRISDARDALAAEVERLQGALRQIVAQCQPHRNSADEALASLACSVMVSAVEVLMLPGGRSAAPAPSSPPLPCDACGTVTPQAELWAARPMEVKHNPQLSHTGFYCRSCLGLPPPGGWMTGRELLAGLQQVMTEEEADLAAHLYYDLRDMPCPDGCPVCSAAVKQTEVER